MILYNELKEPMHENAGTLSCIGSSEFLKIFTSFMDILIFIVRIVRLLRTEEQVR